MVGEARTSAVQCLVSQSLSLLCGRFLHSPISRNQFVYGLTFTLNNNFKIMGCKEKSKALLKFKAVFSKYQSQ